MARGFALFLWEKTNGRGLAEVRTVVVNLIVMVELFYLLDCRLLMRGPTLDTCRAVATPGFPLAGIHNERPRAPAGRGLCRRPGGFRCVAARGPRHLIDKDRNLISVNAGRRIITGSDLSGRITRHERAAPPKLDIRSVLQNIEP